MDDEDSISQHLNGTRLNGDSAADKSTAASPLHDVYDVIVVGGGNAGFTAAVSAAEHLRQSQAKNSSDGDGSSLPPPRVLLVEKAPFDSAGGNTYFTAGAYRYCFRDLADLLPILYDENGDQGISPELIPQIEMQGYSASDFMGDLLRVTGGRCDVGLAKVLVERSRSAVQWIAERGGKWNLSFHRQAYRVDGKWRFWGGMVTTFLGGGKTLSEWLVGLAGRSGVEVAWRTPAVRLLQGESGGVIGVDVLKGGEERVRIMARGGVVLACGGFQADPALRAQWLGPGWDLAHVRGCKYSTGDGHRMAAAVGAQTAGHYSGCHSVCWDANSPRDGGDRQLTNQYTKSGYPTGIMVNLDGHRFLDEGYDMRNYTYAIYGAEVLKQPSGRAFQIWDAEGAKWLRDEEYADHVTINIRAPSIFALADLLASRGLKNKKQLVETITNFNKATSDRRLTPDAKLDPSKKDGLSARGLAVPKSNWAMPLRTPPFTAVEVTSGVTFTFGGLRIVPETAQVVSDATREPIDGLYCCGELMGGLFYGNYPGGSGLTGGTVFGRIAGEHAARSARPSSKAEEARNSTNASMKMDESPPEYSRTPHT